MKYNIGLQVSVTIENIDSIKEIYLTYTYACICENIFNHILNLTELQKYLPACFIHLL